MSQYKVERKMLSQLMKLSLDLAHTDQEPSDILTAFDKIMEVICLGLDHHPASMFRHIKDGNYLCANKIELNSNESLAIGLVCMLLGGKQLSDFVYPSDFIVKSINVEII